MLKQNQVKIEIAPNSAEYKQIVIQAYTNYQALLKELKKDFEALEKAPDTSKPFKSFKSSIEALKAFLESSKIAEIILLGNIELGWICTSRSIALLRIDLERGNSNNWFYKYAEEAFERANVAINAINSHHKTPLPIVYSHAISVGNYLIADAKLELEQFFLSLNKHSQLHAFNDAVEKEAINESRSISNKYFINKEKRILSDKTFAIKVFRSKLKNLFLEVDVTKIDELVNEVFVKKPKDYFNVDLVDLNHKVMNEYVQFSYLDLKKIWPAFQKHFELNNLDRYLKTLHNQDTIDFFDCMVGCEKLSHIFLKLVFRENVSVEKSTVELIQNINKISSDAVAKLKVAYQNYEKQRMTDEIYQKFYDQVKKEAEQRNKFIAAKNVNQQKNSLIVNPEKIEELENKAIEKTNHEIVLDNKDADFVAATNAYHTGEYQKSLTHLKKILPKDYRTASLTFDQIKALFSMAMCYNAIYAVYKYQKKYGLSKKIKQEAIFHFEFAIKLFEFI